MSKVEPVDGSKKALKQAQLPFAITVTPKSIKRKLSVDSKGDQPVKIPCTEPNENVGKENVEKVGGDDLSDSPDVVMPEAEESMETEDADESVVISSEGDTAPSEDPDTFKKLSSTEEEKLTPKMKKSYEKRKERERIRLEKESQRAKLKEEKLRKKQEREDAKQKEREEKQRKKEADIEAKKLKEKSREEERKRREEEKRKKEEAKESERKKKEEVRLDEERKQALLKEAFTSYFKKSKPCGDSSAVNAPEAKEYNFMPFHLKPDMRLSTEPRIQLKAEDKNKLTSFLNKSNPLSKDKLYISELKTGKRKPLKQEATWPLSDELHDVIIIESVGEMGCTEVPDPNNKRKMDRAKLLQFHDNRRPPYWGTWRKKSSAVLPRRPLGRDNVLDYEVDSDSEWEDEGEGEDLAEADSDNEQSDEEEVAGENGYVLDNIFVPHGYLSDEEAPEEENCDPEDQKLRMKVLKQEFDEEMKAKTERLKPWLLGCVWISNGTTDICKGSMYEALMSHRCIWDEESGPIDLSGPIVEEALTTSINYRFPPILDEALVRFVHGNHHFSHIRLVKDFMALVEKEHPNVTVSKRGVSLRIKDIAAKTQDSTGKHVWVVSADLCVQYGLSTLIEPPKAVPTPVQPSPVCEKIKTPILPAAKETPPTTPVVKKRVTLISLPPVTPKQNQPSFVDSAKVDLPQLPVTPTEPAPTKKRVPLVFLERIPPSSPHLKKHEDTPRPIHTFFAKRLPKAVPPMKESTTEVIDID